MRRVLERLHEPVVQVELLLGSGVLAGFATLLIAWNGVADSSLVPLQLPWLASGAVAGLALIGSSLAVLGTYEERRAGALRQRQLDDVIGQLALATARIGALAEQKAAPKKPAARKRVRKATG